MFAFDVEFMVLAEDVRFHPGGGFNITRGGINTLIVEELPIDLPKLCVAYSLRIAWDTRYSRLDWALDLTDPQGKPLSDAASEKRAVQVQPAPERIHDRDIHILAFHTFTDLVLRDPGVYRTRLSVEGDVRGEATFQVVVGTAFPQDHISSVDLHAEPR